VRLHQRSGARRDPAHLIATEIGLVDPDDCDGLFVFAPVGVGDGRAEKDLVQLLLLSVSSLLMDWIGSTHTTTPCVPGSCSRTVFGERLVIDRGLGINADGGQFFEDVVKAIVLRRSGLSGLSITPPQDRDLVGPGVVLALTIREFYAR
jgi:hypothetical protein